MYFIIVIELTPAEWARLQSGDFHVLLHEKKQSSNAYRLLFTQVMRGKTHLIKQGGQQGRKGPTNRARALISWISRRVKDSSPNEACWLEML